MTHARRDFRGSSRGTAAARRRTAWEDGPGGTGAQSLTSSTSVIVGSGAASLRDGQTLARIRGNLRITARALAAAGDHMAGAFGIGIVKAPAFAIGITAIPTPITEQDDEDWLFWSAIAVGGLVNEGLGLMNIPIDTKAMRKLSIGDTIYGCLEVGTEVGTVTMVAFFDTRALIFLP